jgi:hypothetical protein
MQPVLPTAQAPALATVFDGKPIENSCPMTQGRVFEKPAMQSNVTQIIQVIEQGDPQPSRQLLPPVYEELRKLAVQ